MASNVSQNRSQNIMHWNGIVYVTICTVVEMYIERGPRASRRRRSKHFEIAFDEDKNSLEFARRSTSTWNWKGKEEASRRGRAASARFRFLSFCTSVNRVLVDASLSSRLLPPRPERRSCTWFPGVAFLRHSNRMELSPRFSGGHHRAVPIGHGPGTAIDPRGTREALVYRPRRIRPSLCQGLYTYLFHLSRPFNSTFFPSFISLFIYLCFLISLKIYFRYSNFR